MNTATKLNTTETDHATQDAHADRLAEMPPASRRRIAEKLERMDERAKHSMRERMSEEYDREIANARLIDRLNDERCVVLALNYYVLSRVAGEDTPHDDIAVGLSAIARTVANSIREISDELTKNMER
ncbi:MAG: hypothetical protein KGL46_13125 [Hyphomicrobiales bacterium]|nr:hypothetical protein [Hyphomicrobiales bacterium]